MLRLFQLNFKRFLLFSARSLSTTTRIESKTKYSNSPRTSDDIQSSEADQSENSRHSALELKTPPPVKTTGKNIEIEQLVQILLLVTNGQNLISEDEIIDVVCTFVNVIRRGQCFGPHYYRIITHFKSLLPHSADSHLRIIKFTVGLLLFLTLVFAAIVTVFDISVFENVVQLYQNWFRTEPIFILKAIEPPTLIEEIQELSKLCWHICGNVFDNMVDAIRVISASVIFVILYGKSILFSCYR